MTLPSTAARRLSAAPKRYLLGTHRIRSPESTWSRIQLALEKIGVTRVADVTALDCLGIPVYQAIRPSTRSISVSQGKGVTAAAARVSAAMESVEHWHAERVEQLPAVDLSLREIQRANPISSSDLPWRASGYRLSALSIPWVRAESLLDRKDAWLPRQIIDLDMRVPETIVPRMFHRSSNGLASGNCRQEALLHGLCECIERHVIACANVDPGTKAAIDPETIDSEYCRTLVDQIGAAGAKLAVFGFTSRLQVPVVFVELVLPDLPRRWIGSGCHPAPEVALSRALTEAAQSRLTYISGARDDLVEFDHSTGVHSAYDEYIEPSGSLEFGDLGGVHSDTVEEDCTWVLERLAEANCRPYYVDLTRADIGIAVGKSFIPGFKEAHDAG